MNPNFPKEEWSDPRFKNLTPEMRLTRIWLMINPGVDMAGGFLVWGDLFALQTGLDIKWLATTLQHDKVGAGFVSDGDRILDVGFVRRNYPGLLIRNGKQNRMVPAILNCVQTWPLLLQTVFYSTYPALAKIAEEYVRSPSVDVRSPAQGIETNHVRRASPAGDAHARADAGLPLPAEAPVQCSAVQCSEGEGSGEGCPPADVMPSTPEQVIALGEMRNIPPDVCRLYFHDRTRSGWNYSKGGATVPIFNWHSDLQVFHHHYQGAEGERKNRGGGRSAEESGPDRKLERLLDAETDPVRRQAIIKDWAEKEAAS